MSDQKRWFKLWHSANSDDKINSLPPALRWAWASFGTHTKVHGTNGKVVISPLNKTLAASMGVAVEDLKKIISVLPHMQIKEGPCDNGEFTVTWNKWQRFQEDSTVAERVKALRSKRRGEEKRGEEEEKRPSSPPTPPPKAYKPKEKTPDDYFTFQKAYPDHRAEDTPTCRQVYRQVRKEAPPEQILLALEQDKGSPKWQEEDGKYIPGPTKWLRRRRWNVQGELNPKWEPPEERAKKGDRSGLAHFFADKENS